MTSIKEIAWVAALVEGEGCFRINNNSSPTIQVAMTDLDVLERLKMVVKSDNKITSTAQPGRKMRYTVTLSGNIAIQWMMTIYSFMSLRRKAKIREILHFWRCRKSKKEMFAHHRLIKSMMISRKISREEAEKVYLEILMEN